MANNLLAASDVLRTIGSVLLAILILLLMITVHEFGHYLAGKIFKFKIEEFSIGFGPAFFKIKRKKSGELFAVRLIPLGGYCAFAGEDGLEEEHPFFKRKEKGKETAAPEKEAVSGETVLVTAPLAKSANEAPVSEIPPAKEPPVSEIPPVEGTAEGTEKGRKKRPAKGPSRKELWTEEGAFTTMHPWKRIVVLLAGAIMNYLLALLLITACLLGYGQTMPAVYTMESAGELPAEYLEYSLKDRDILLKAGGSNLYLTTDLARAVNGKKAGDLIEMVVSRAIGLEKWTDEDGTEHVTFDHREEMTVSVMLRADVSVKNSADIEGVYQALGIATPATGSVRFGFFETLGRSFIYSWKIAGSILKIIGELFTGNLGLSALGGPVTTISTTATVASRSFRGFLEIAGFIGVNLAVFNLLPVPALDGSKIVFTAIEWARGRPISRKIEAIIHFAGLIFLIGFAILVDILQFV